MSATSSPTTSASVRRILVVDDHEDIRRIVCLSLQRALASVEIVEAADGFQALEQVRKHPPDLIVLDVMMPGLDGIEVCRRVRSEGHAGIAILMLTGKADHQSREIGFQAGTDDYIVKPFQRGELCNRVRRLLERHSFH